MRLQRLCGKSATMTDLGSIPNTSTMFVRIKSHRARSKVMRALGREPKGYYSWTFLGEFREIQEKEYDRVKNIKGVTRARVDESQLREYINW